MMTTEITEPIGAMAVTSGNVILEIKPLVEPIIFSNIRIITKGMMQGRFCEILPSGDVDKEVDVEKDGRCIKPRLSDFGDTLRKPTADELIEHYTTGARIQSVIIDGNRTIVNLEGKFRLIIQ